MKLWPDSLYGRLVLVLVAGLAVAQVISGLIALSERDQAVFRYSDMQWAQRDADAVTLMESASTAERGRIASVLTTPRLFVSFGAHALDPGPAPAQTDASAADFEKMLTGLLPGRVVRVSVIHGPLAANASLPGDHFPPYAPGQAHVLTQVQFRDGAWVYFDHPRPWSVVDSPWRLLLSLAVLFISVIVLAWLAVRGVTRPLSGLASAADELGRDIHRSPLPEQGPAEVRRAAAAFNTMQARIREFVDERLRFLTAVSHDLRTPITRLRLRAELLDDAELRGKFVHDLAEMEQLVGRTLDFLRGLDAREASQVVDLRALLETLQSDAAEAGADVKLGEVEVATLTARPAALRRCLENLVNNAVRYGGRVDLSAVREDGRVAIRVRDHGPGIPEAELQKVFEPYYRLESSRNRDGGGMGLGLGIARNIVQTHGGSLVLHNHPEGGLEAVVRLPA